MNRPSDATLDKVMNGTASTTEAKQVAQWFKTLEGQAYLSLAMDKDFEASDDFGDAASAIHPPVVPFEYTAKPTLAGKIVLATLKVAAVMVPIVWLSITYLYFDKRIDVLGLSGYEEICVPKGARRQLSFPDGSSAYINGDTKVKYPRLFGLWERKIELEGEAYFVIQKNPQYPFVVTINDAKVKVLGTSFNLEAYPKSQKIIINLDEGKVNLIPYPDAAYTMKPGQKLVYDRNSGECRIREQNTHTASLWKDHIIQFEDSPLKEIVEVLNRWYNVPFVIDDTRALSYTYTFVSDANVTLESILNDLEKITPVRFIREDSLIKVRMNRSSSEFQ